MPTKEYGARNGSLYYKLDGDETWAEVGTVASNDTTFTDAITLNTLDTDKKYAAVSDKTYTIAPVSSPTPGSIIINPATWTTATWTSGGSSYDSDEKVFFQLPANYLTCIELTSYLTGDKVYLPVNKIKEITEVSENQTEVKVAINTRVNTIYMVEESFDYISELLPPPVGTCKYRFY